MTYPQPWKFLPSPPAAPKASAEVAKVRNHDEALRRCIKALFVVLTIALACALVFALR